MRRRARSIARRVVVSLLMLATLLAYAMPAQAGLTQHRPSAPPHEHALADAHDHSVAAGHEHRREPCEDPDLLDAGACCSVAQCATMHGGLAAVSFETHAPRLDAAVHAAVHATPEGIDVDPALRPPCLTV